MDRSKAVAMELLSDRCITEALKLRRLELLNEVSRIDDAMAAMVGAVRVETTSGTPGRVPKTAEPRLPRRGGRPRKAQSGAPENKEKPGRGAMREHLAKAIGGKRGEAMVTGEIVDGLKQTFPEVYGEIETQVLAGRVSACLSYNAKVFKCLGRGEGYVLADEGRAA